MKKTLFPSNIFDLINNAINYNSKFLQASDKTKLKAKQICLNLWYFIYSKQMENIKVEEMKGNSINDKFYVNIHSSQLNRKEYRVKVNNEDLYYNFFLELLIDNNLIEFNDKFSISNFSMSYRVCKFNGKFTYVNIDMDIIFGYFKSKKELIKEFPKYKNLIEDCYKTKVDINKYSKFLIDNCGKTIKKLSSRYVNKDGKKFKILVERILDEEKIMELINEAVKINIGILWISVSEEGRFYSSITNLSHLASDFLTYNREKLYSLDITNCQPLLLNIIIDNTYLKAATENGIFYDIIAKEMCISRSKVKNLCYRYIFFNNELVKGGVFMNVINELFPGLVNQINEVKANNKLSSLLQRIEADIIIKSVGSLDLPKVTKHDEVFTTINYLNEVKLFIEKLIKERYNLSVKVNNKQDKINNYYY